MAYGCDIALAATTAGYDRIRLTEAVPRAVSKDYQASPAVAARVAHELNACTIISEPASRTRIKGGESLDVTAESLSVTLYR